MSDFSQENECIAVLTALSQHVTTSSAASLSPPHNSYSLLPSAFSSPSGPAPPPPHTPPLSTSPYRHYSYSPQDSAADIGTSFTHWVKGNHEHVSPPAYSSLSSVPVHANPSMTFPLTSKQFDSVTEHVVNTDAGSKRRLDSKVRGKARSRSNKPRSNRSMSKQPRSSSYSNAKANADFNADKDADVHTRVNLSDNETVDTDSNEKAFIHQNAQNQQILGLSVPPQQQVLVQSKEETFAFSHHEEKLCANAKIIEDIAVEEKEAGKVEQSDGAEEKEKNHEMASDLSYSDDGSNSDAELKPISVAEVLSKKRASTMTGLVYDERFELHEDYIVEHPECSLRTKTVWMLLVSNQLVKNSVWVQAREATDEELILTHSRKHIDAIERTTGQPLQYIGKDSRSTYANQHSCLAARLACGGLIDLMRLVCTGKLNNGFALIRPPGHHCFKDIPGGFCLFNNCAVAVNVMLKLYPQMKIALIDLDVHHFNGTQSIFYESNQVLLLSIHQYDNGNFYPSSGAATEVGKGKGKGFTVNFPLNFQKMTDLDYDQAFNMVFIPIIEQFGPDLIVIAAGFDAAENDPLGAQCVSPMGFARMFDKLMRVPLRGDKFLDSSSRQSVPVVGALEGGYNVNVLSDCVTRCVRVLQGETIRPQRERGFLMRNLEISAQMPSHHEQQKMNFEIQRKAQFARDLQRVIKIQSAYWKLETVEEREMDPLEKKHAAEALDPLVKIISYTRSRTRKPTQVNVSSTRSSTSSVATTIDGVVSLRNVAELKDTIAPETSSPATKRGKAQVDEKRSIEISPGHRRRLSNYRNRNRNSDEYDMEKEDTSSKLPKAYEEEKNNQSSNHQRATSPKITMDRRSKRILAIDSNKATVGSLLQQEVMETTKVSISSPPLGKRSHASPIVSTTSEAIQHEPTSKRSKNSPQSPNRTKKVKTKATFIEISENAPPKSGSADTSPSQSQLPAITISPPQSTVSQRLSVSSTSASHDVIPAESAASPLVSPAFEHTHGAFISSPSSSSSTYIYPTDPSQHYHQGIRMPGPAPNFASYALPMPVGVASSVAAYPNTYARYPPPYALPQNAHNLLVADVLDANALLSQAVTILNRVQRQLNQARSL